MKMKVNYIKAIPIIIREGLKLLPIFIKYFNFLKNDIIKMYDKDEIIKLDEEIKRSLEVGENE